MAHQFHGHARRRARVRQQGGESVAQRMEIDDTAQTIPIGDATDFEILAYLT